MPRRVVESASSERSDEIQEEHLRRNPPRKLLSKGKELAKPSSQSQRKKVAGKKKEGPIYDSEDDMRSLLPMLNLYPTSS